MSSIVSLVVAALGLSLVQVAAAVPWLWVLDPALFRSAKRRADLVAWLGGALAGLAVLCGFALRDPSRIEFLGRIYGSILHGQLLVDLFVLVFFLMLKLWPRGGAVALASFRESVRQPMYWLIFAITLFALVFSMVIPYFTFGDDFKMMSNLGYDVIMLASTLFGVLAASLSIHEEIEGRTAITLMSKPVTRRHFLLGKFFGITLACFALASLLGWCLNWTMYVQPSLNRLDDAIDPLAQQMQYYLEPYYQKAAFGNPEAGVFLGGAGIWMSEVLARGLGLVLCFGQVMILVAIAAALATRMPFVINLVLVLTVFFLGHLAPVLVRFTANLNFGGARLVGFLAQAFDVVLPALEFFNMGPVIIRTTSLNLGQYATYVGQVSVYALIYTAIAMLFGLILFEDRDLA